MEVLPDRLSALLRLALDDLRAVAGDHPLYEVDMTVWHHPALLDDDDDGLFDRCLVCLAGSACN